MKSGAPAFGTPEYMKACIAAGQLARRYRLPYRTSSTNAANSVDAQAAYETVFSLWGAIMGGGNLIVHAAGWLEGGLTASYEKFALDIDCCRWSRNSSSRLWWTTTRWRSTRWWRSARADISSAHSTRCSDTPRPSINRSSRTGATFSQWQGAGSPQADRKANAVWKRALAEYKEPALDPEIAAAIDAFVARRKTEGGEVTDF